MNNVKEWALRLVYVVSTLLAGYMLGKSHGMTQSRENFLELQHKLDQNEATCLRSRIACDQALATCEGRASECSAEEPIDLKGPRL